MSFSKSIKQAFLTAVLLLLALPCNAAPTQPLTTETFNNRNIILYLPSHLPTTGTRALVVVLHGGMGNAQRIAYGQEESALNMDAVAEKNGFIVAYLNGTPVTRFFGDDKLGWNAGGGCCGQPALKNTDDVGYITGAVAYLTDKYGIDRTRVYGVGHSNGAMMTLRLICETNLYAASVSIAGPLNLDVEQCPAAQGKRILAIHGADDTNVPVAGGQGSKGLSNATYNSERRTQQVFTNSGASYTLDLVQNADHKLDHIETVVEQTENQTIAEKAARFFGLLNQAH